VDIACYANALAIYGKSGQMNAGDWLKAKSVDNTQLFEGNSVMRGQKQDDKIIVCFFGVLFVLAAGWVPRRGFVDIGAPVV
jgi:hypothetical protein